VTVTIFEKRRKKMRKIILILIIGLAFFACDDGKDTETHVHDYGTAWKSNAAQHWRECSCGEKADAADHTAGDWKVDQAATETTAGSQHKECTVCGYEMETGIIPVLDPICECPEGTTHEPNETCCDGTNCVCSEAVAKTQNSPNTPMFADKTATITTTDTFTDKQWNAIVTAIAGKFSTAYDVASDNRKSSYASAFEVGITIIVEKNPTGYTNYKVTQDGQTLYVRADGVNNLDPVQFILAVNNGEEKIA
jgi:hypothetical protein